MKRIAVLAIVLAVAALAAFVVPTLAQGPMGSVPRSGFGMMGGRGFGFGANSAITSTVPYGYGHGGMMGGWGNNGAPSAIPLTLDQAITRAQQYVASFNNADLKLVEVEEYTWNFYGVVREKSTGTDTFQILVNKYNGAVYPEMGPNMMWNTKYSPMAWMILAPHASAGVGGWFTPSSAKLTVTMGQARADAAQYLKSYLPNATVEDQGDTFYGYYNFDVLQNGKTYGMLSVNGYTGAVWDHTWHGDFVTAKTLD